MLVRHGETEWSRARRHTGRTDLPLTRVGELQADAVVPMLAGRDFARVLASPLRRAMETCRRAGFGDRVEQCDDALEWDYGIFEGRLTADIRTEIPDWSVWTHHITGGENVEQVGARADRLIATARSSDGDVVLFAHAHLLRVLAARWLGLDPARGRSFVLDTASVSVLSHERGEPVIARWNATGHQSPDRIT